MKNNKLLNLKNDLDKSIFQAEAAINALCIEDHFDAVDRNTLNGVLWILSDNIERIKRNVRKISGYENPLI